MDEISRPKFWYDRGYLPHYDGGRIIQFVTFRLADSLPGHILERFKIELERDLISEIEFHRKIDRYLDNGEGKKYLAITEIAESVEQTLLKFNDIKFKLHSWVIMPNHVHVLFAPQEGHSLAGIMHSIKSFTANFANKFLDRKRKILEPGIF